MAVVIIADMTISNWYSIVQASVKDTDNKHFSNIPVTPYLMWSGICRTASAIGLSWPTCRLTIYSMYEDKVCLVSSCEAVHWNMEAAMATLRDFETNNDTMLHSYNAESMREMCKNLGDPPDINAPLLVEALGKAVLTLNSNSEKNKDKNVNVSSRILFVDGSSKGTYVSQISNISSVMHSCETLGIPVDVCALQSDYSPVVEMLSSTTGGLFSSFSRELSVDTKDGAMGVRPALRFFESNELIRDRTSFVDYLLFHYLSPPSLSSSKAWGSLSSSIATSQGYPCICHGTYITGVMRTCPSCAAVYCLKGKDLAICLGCKLRLKRKPLRQLRMSDKISEKGI